MGNYFNTCLHELLLGLNESGFRPNSGPGFELKKLELNSHFVHLSR